MKRKSKTVQRVVRALGASRVLDLGRVEHTPMGMLALTERVRKLRSTGPGGTGRPGNPRATLPRIVKFRPRVWRLLTRVAGEQARATGRHVSPAQVASILIEVILGTAAKRRKRAQ